MFRNRAAGRQFVHAFTEPADIVKRVQFAQQDFLAGETGGHLPELLHANEGDRAVCQRR
jgi:hypothetical protein